VQVQRRDTKLLAWGALALLVIATLLAAFLRLFKLGQFPPGFTFDEAAHALDALDILNGHPMLLSSRLKEAPAGYSYLLAAAFYLFGASPVVHRVTIAVGGVLLIPVNFMAVLQVFRPAVGRNQARFLAAFSSLLLSTSLWAVLTSRLGFEYILAPSLALAATAFFWRGYHGPHWGLLLLAAVFSAGTYYLYNGASSFLLVIPAAVVLHNFVARLPHRRDAAESRAEVPEVPWKALILFVAAVLFLTAPLLAAIYDWSNLENQRTLNSLIFTNSSRPLEQLAASLWAHARTFLGLHGDEYWWRGLPALNPFLGVCLVAGLLISIRRFRQLPYLWVLVYWAGMLSGAVLTFEGSVKHFRMAGALPPTYLLISIAWAEAYRWLKRFLSGAAWFRPAAYAPAAALAPFLAAALIWLPLQTYTDYFVRWANAPDLATILDVPSVKLVERMRRETDPAAIFVLPRSPDALRPNFILDFLYTGQAPLRYLPVDEAALPQVLTRALAGYDRVHLITRLDGAREGVQQLADPEGLLPLLLTQHSQVIDVEDADGYVILTYRLESNQVMFQPARSGWHIPAGFEPLSIAGGGLKLAGVRWQVHQDRLQVDLAWQREAEIAHNYTVSVQLLDAGGQRVAGVDAAPDRGFMTLALSEVMVTSYDIPLPAGMEPGQYTLRVALYYFSGGQAVTIGSAPLPQPVVIN
jgi:hypothetical protein